MHKRSMKINHIIAAKVAIKRPLTCSMQSIFLNACSANPETFRTHLLSTRQLAVDR